MPKKIPNAKVLMTIKTYPNLSKKHGELVCTAGIWNGHLIRIYPIPFRYLDELEQFKKYQWIKISLHKRSSAKDFRYESYSPDNDKFELLEDLSINKYGWCKRMEYINQVKYYTSMQELIELSQKEPYVSLGILKPKEIKDFIVEGEKERDWSEEQKNYFKQLDLFEKPQELKLEKLPYKYSYVFTTDDGKTRTLMIEDWEIGALFLNCRRQYGGDEKRANEDVKKKYMKMAENKNIFFFVGTSLKHHFVSKNPFIIIGVVSPKEGYLGQPEQLNLF